jgi:nucleoside phosphorylase
MRNLIHLVINEDVIDRSGISEKFSERLDRSKIEYLQVKNLDQFDRLISLLPEELKIQVWIHPNNAFRRSRNFGSTAEQDIAIALKKRKKIKFNLVTRVIDEDMKAFAAEIGVGVYKTTELWKLSGKIDIQTVGEMRSRMARTNQKKIGTPKSMQNAKLKKSTTMASDDPDVDYAIITALYDQEFEMLEEFIENQVPISGFDTLIVGNIKGSDKKVLLDFQGQMGMVDCAALSAQIVERFKPKYLILCGVCGGRKSKGVKLLDIVVPNKVFEYHSGKYVKGRVKPYLRSVNINNKKPTQVKGKILSSMKSYVGMPLKSIVENISVHTKSMACGNWVVKDSFLQRQLAKKDEEVVGLEMESYGIARAGEILKGHGVTIFVIKSVMDLTDESKNDKRKAEAGYLSACFTYFLIKDHL